MPPGYKTGLGGAHDPGPVFTGHVQCLQEMSCLQCLREKHQLYLHVP